MSRYWSLACMWVAIQVDRFWFWFDNLTGGDGPRPAV